jgi:hypothetical protein
VPNSTIEENKEGPAINASELAVAQRGTNVSVVHELPEDENSHSSSS